MRHAPGGENFGSGFAGSGAQSLRASDTWTKPARSVSDGWPVKFDSVSISSRSDGTSSRSTSENTRAISTATRRRKRSAWTKSTADRKRACRNRFGHASGTCAFRLLMPPDSCQFLERGGRLAEQDVLQRGVRPIGQLDLGRDHAEFSDHIERGAVDVGGRILFHPGREITDAQAFHRCGCVEVEVTRHARHVARIGSADRAQHEHRVFDAAGHRSELVERPAERHRAGARHATERRTQACDTAAHRRRDDAPAGLAADREADQSRPPSRRQARRSIPTRLLRAATGSSSGRRTRCRSVRARRGSTSRSARRLPR